MNDQIHIGVVLHACCLLHVYPCIWTWCPNTRLLALLVLRLCQLRSDIVGATEIKNFYRCSYLELPNHNKYSCAVFYESQSQWIPPPTDQRESWKSFRWYISSESSSRINQVAGDESWLICSRNEMFTSIAHTSRQLEERICYAGVQDNSTIALRSLELTRILQV